MLIVLSSVYHFHINKNNPECLMDCYTSKINWPICDIKWEKEICYFYIPHSHSTAYSYFLHGGNVKIYTVDMATSKVTGVLTDTLHTIKFITIVAVCALSIVCITDFAVFVITLCKETVSVQICLPPIIHWHVWHVLF